MCPTFASSASNCLTRYKHILSGCSLGCKKALNFTCLTMKFHNPHHNTLHLCSYLDTKGAVAAGNTGVWIADCWTATGIWAERFTSLLTSTTLRSPPSKGKTSNPNSISSSPSVGILTTPLTGLPTWNKNGYQWLFWKKIVYLYSKWSQQDSNKWMATLPDKWRSF